MSQLFVILSLLISFVVAGCFGGGIKSDGVSDRNSSGGENSSGAATAGVVPVDPLTDQWEIQLNSFSSAPNLNGYATVWGYVTGGPQPNVDVPEVAVVNCSKVAHCPPSTFVPGDHVAIYPVAANGEFNVNREPSVLAIPGDKIVAYAIGKPTLFSESIVPEFIRAAFGIRAYYSKLHDIANYHLAVPTAGIGRGLLICSKQHDCYCDQVAEGDRNGMTACMAAMNGKNPEKTVYWKPSREYGFDLSNYRIRALLEGWAGELIIGTDQGLVVVPTAQNFKFTSDPTKTIFITSEDGLVNDDVQSLSLGSGLGQIVVGHTGGLSIYNTQTNEIKTKSLSPTATISSLLRTSHNQVLATVQGGSITERGLFRVSMPDGVVTLSKATDDVANIQMNEVIELTRGTLIVATASDRLRAYSLSSPTDSTSLYRIKGAEIYVPNKVNDLQGAGALFYVGHQTGISIRSEAQPETLLATIGGDKLIGPNAFTLHLSDDNILRVSSQYDVKISQGITSIHLRDASPYHDKIISFDSDFTNTLPDNNVTAIHETPDGTKWIGSALGMSVISSAGIVTYLTDAKFGGDQIPNQVNDISFDSIRNILYAGSRKGLYRCDLSTTDPSNCFSDNVDHFQLSGSSQVPNVQTVHVQPSGRVVVGGDFGLFTYPLEPGRDSLLDELGEVLALEEANGILWVGSEKGLARVKADSLELVGDVIEVGNWVTTVLVDATLSRVWFGGLSGLYWTGLDGLAGGSIEVTFSGETTDTYVNDFSLVDGNILVATDSPYCSNGVIEECRAGLWLKRPAHESPININQSKVDSTWLIASSAVSRILNGKNEVIIGSSNGGLTVWKKATPASPILSTVFKD